MHDYLGSRPQLERGALGSAVIAGGVKMKLIAIWFCGNRSMAKGASDRTRTFVDLLEADTGVPRDCLPAAMDDRVAWRKRAMGGRWGGGGGGGRGGLTKVDLIVVVEVVVVVYQYLVTTANSLLQTSQQKSVLLYGLETGRTTQATLHRFQAFINSCLRKIPCIWWPKKIRNEDPWKTANQEQVAEQIPIRKWGWSGHTLGEPASNITRQALTWNPQGKRKRGRPRNT